MSDFLTLFNGTFVQLSNLRRNFALSKNFDKRFTYSVLSQQDSVSIEFVLILYAELFDLEIYRFGSQKLQQDELLKLS